MIELVVQEDALDPWFSVWEGRVQSGVVGSEGLPLAPHPRITATLTVCQGHKTVKELLAYVILWSFWYSSNFTRIQLPFPPSLSFISFCLIWTAISDSRKGQLHSCPHFLFCFYLGHLIFSPPPILIWPISLTLCSENHHYVRSLLTMCSCCSPVFFLEFPFLVFFPTLFFFLSP